ncbi:3'(2'),5'-bisphosphate nucleotidase CysQ [Pseudofulvimonas gallinarii]|uniref:3'(2'),5'-bisphosphate nucleotidase CysQ n=1 Tax=Pseudofulvimonas gallinarii TaxID=634155 RepID=A0A4R3L425_9GAMM|nr:3'(2'),5'-bisphosphate nucleotidase CysQ [Pseudofulvimonas gallinarii]TCS94501.1 3'(2'),5'-bisphosphate nucleotidase [Pseudofulvimonas gallinarii]THD14544.1 3'(2'),5'-bisphosphate nucleotidase [Pseudofulvimonas gallinarii]
MSVPDFAAEACRLARAAGQAILAVYRRDFDVAIKDDHSPLTEADLASHRLLVDGLSAIAPGLPVVSEESAVQVPAVERLRWPRYWLVDPLDGTREFIKRNDEFTVNIALVENRRPVFGIVHAPALDELAWAARGVGAWHEQGGIRSALAGRPLPEVPVVCVSRSHASARTQTVLDALGTHEALAAGSALKFIRLAQGRADLYPRLGPTSEWDTAAGQCIVEEAGGSLVDFAGVAFHYNRGESLLNPGFLAAADGRVDWARRLQPVLPREAQA